MSSITTPQARYIAPAVPDGITPNIYGWVQPALTASPARPAPVATRPVAVARNASPPIRHGALQAPNGQYAGRTYFNPINGSASPVVGAYSPYPTMLYAPQMFDGVGYATQLYLNSLRNRPQPSFLAMQQRQAAPRASRAGKAKAPATPAQPTAPGLTLKDYRASTADDYGDPGGTFGVQPPIASAPKETPAPDKRGSATYWGGLNTGFGARGWTGQGGLGGVDDRSARSTRSSSKQTFSAAREAWDRLPLTAKFFYYYQTGQWGPVENEE